MNAPGLTPVAAAAARDPAWDFVPGEREIFIDDFSDLAPGGAPQRWKVRGAPVDVKQTPAGKELLITKPTTLTATLGTIPANFTVESGFDLSEPEPKSAHPWIRLQLGTSPYSSPIDVVLQLNWTARTGEAVATSSGHSLGRTPLKFDPAQSLSLDLWMQDRRLRVYVNNERLIDANQLDPKTMDTAYLSFTSVSAPIGLVKFRVAESAPDFAQSIQASGRFVTHGIHFDVDSDRIQPESFGVLKVVAASLQARPDLQVRIEGHTDATGDASYNLDLSRRRAEAVRGALISQFGVDSARLTAAGRGSTTPLASNDSPEGRAQNRRVEFVKQ
jgi:outer membrane protein OmpA-like peptidoglycan-associated protein